MGAKVCKLYLYSQLLEQLENYKIRDGFDIFEFGWFFLLLQVTSPAAGCFRLLLLLLLLAPLVLLPHLLLLTGDENPG